MKRTIGALIALVLLVGLSPTLAGPAYPNKAFDLIARYIKTEAPESVYDALLLPALNYAERDRLPFG